MAIIGFAALFIFGIWLVVAGFGGMWATYGLTGKILWPGVIFGIAGVVILAIAVLNSPFTVSMVQ